MLSAAGASAASGDHADSISPAASRRGAVHYLVRMALGAGALGIGVMLSLAVLSLMARRPALGVRDGRLTPCRKAPNSVSSQAEDDAHRIEPLRFTGTPAAAMQRLEAIVTSMPRTTVIVADSEYLYAECRSRLFRFVDDVEFVIEPSAGVIHCRSASRAGHSDLGVNRARIEEIRRAFAAQQ